MATGYRGHFRCGAGEIALSSFSRLAAGLLSWVWQASAKVVADNEAGAQASAVVNRCVRALLADAASRFAQVYRS